MKLGIEIFISFLVILLGYGLCCRYFCLEARQKITFKLSRNRSIYLCCAAVSFGVLLYFFTRFFYDKTLLEQMKLLVLVGLLFPMAAVDYRYHQIPNQMLLIGLIIRIILWAAELFIDSTNAIQVGVNGVLGAAIIGGFFLLILLFFKNSIGMGDIKLFALMGLYQGLWGLVNSVFYSLCVIFLLSICLLVTKKKKRKDAISFGPSILIGTILAIGLSGM